MLVDRSLVLVAPVEYVPSMRRAIVPAGLVLTLALVSCGSDASPPSESGAPTTGVSSDTTSTSRPAGILADQYGVRYCEVLTLTIAESGTDAEVWGTQGLNDCPQAAFDAIEPAVVAADLGVTAAIVNGPRFWVLDGIVANAMAGSGEIRDFGGIEMRSIAIVDLGAGLPDPTPFTERSVNRDTEFSFAAGRTIYELMSPDGSVYVMQSYSVQTDPTQTAESLLDLGERLQLPEGWTFATTVLDEDIVVEDIDGVAVVIQDDLQNSYQLRTRG